MPDAEFDPQALQAAARAAKERAYAPYSTFRVGAALLASDGTVFQGCNVENASFGLTVCAERVAIQTAVAAGVTSFRAVAIATDKDVPVPPCGACRQVLREFAPDLQVVLEQDPEPIVVSLAELLPRSFGPEDL